jgi:hypothetical protein
MRGRVSRKSLHMDFINQELLQRQMHGRIAGPIKPIVDDQAFGHEARAVSVVWNKTARNRQRIIGQQEIIPVPALACECLGIRIEQELVFVESQPLGRVEFTAHLVGVHLPCPDALDKRVPYVFGFMLHANYVARGVLVAKEKEIDLRGVLGIKGKIDSAGLERGSQGIVASGQKAL